MRYLNPRRALFSIITLICLLGVAFGVMVLVVVLSVMGGLEVEVKNRVLGLSPHIQIKHLGGDEYQSQLTWTELADRIEALPEVEHAGAFVEDYALLNHLGQGAPMTFNAVDPEDQGRLEELGKLLDGGGQGSFDLGYEQAAVISDRVASNYGIILGDKIKLFSARNSEEALRRYEITREPMLAEREAGDITRFKEDWAEGTRLEGETERVNLELLRATYDWALLALEGPVRDGEKAILNAILDLLESGEAVEGGVDQALPEGTRAALVAEWSALESLDKREEDFKIFEGLETVILPKEMEVVGIYQATSHVRMPELFIPINHAQQLAGFSGDQVGAIAVRTRDAFRAAETKQAILPLLDEGWYAVTWMEQFGQWFELIARERWMMRLALGCIMLVSAFCIGAVMFTITMQKKREIGVMKALGSLESQMVSVFVFQGVVIGLVGAGLGVLLGWLVIVNRGPIQKAMASVGADPFPGNFHGFDSIPALMSAGEIAGIAAMAVVLCTAAAWVPAHFAARADAAKSLRNM